MRATQIDEDSEVLRLQRAVDRSTGKDVPTSPRRRYGAAAVEPDLPVVEQKKTTPEWQRKERLRLEGQRSAFASRSEKSFGTLVRLAGFNEPDPDADEEEIIVEPVSPLPQERPDRDAEYLRLRQEEEERAEREQQRAREERERLEREEAERNKPPTPEPESETDRIAREINARLKLSPESQRKKDQEQISLQAQLRQEKQKAQEERDFANKALDVLTSSASAPKPPPTKKCGRCDKDTPISQFTCVHCGFSMMSGMFSF